MQILGRKEIFYSSLSDFFTSPHFAFLFFFHCLILDLSHLFRVLPWLSLLSLVAPQHCKQTIKHPLSVHTIPRRYVCVCRCIRVGFLFVCGCVAPLCARMCVGVYSSIMVLFTHPGGLRLTLIFSSRKPFALEITSPRRRSAHLTDTPPPLPPLTL